MKRTLTLSLLVASLMISSLPFISPDISSVSSYAYSSLQGFSPKNYKDGRQYGNGVYFAPHDVTIYEKESETSPVVEKFHWDKQNAEMFNLTSALTNKSMPIRNVFISFYPQADVAMMPVISESAGLGPDGKEIDDPNEPTSWVEVIYDQEHKKSGWVRLSEHHDDVKPTSHVGLYQSWLDFMKYNAKAVGVYWLTGVSQYQRGLRQKDTDDSPMIETMVIRDLKVRHVRGNWLLVEVLDFAHNTPIGWMRWRDDEGNLMAFPNLSQEKGPVIITGF